jgi:uncharacterized lipoprotein YmbA
MMNCPSYLFRGCIILSLLLIVLSGCASTEPSRFYILSSLYDTEAEQVQKASEQGIAIGVGPVKIPAHLNRPQIVTRTSQNELKLAEFDKWAGSFKDDFTRVLAKNLSVLLSTERVSVLPWKRSIPIDYQVAIDVSRFDGMLGEDVMLRAKWTIFGDDGKTMISMRTSEIKEEIEGQGYNTFVQAQSRALANLSRDIADAIKSLSKEQGR